MTGPAPDPTDPDPTDPDPTDPDPTDPDPTDPDPTDPGGPVLVLDQRGRRCPLPVIEMARRIGDVPVGGRVGVAADDPAARLDVPAWCRMRGHDYAGETAAGDGVPVYTVRRRA